MAPFRGKPAALETLGGDADPRGFRIGPRDIVRYIFFRKAADNTRGYDDDDCQQQQQQNYPAFHFLSLAQPGMAEMLACVA
jgi:hypothetical protein